MRSRRRVPRSRAHSRLCAASSAVTLGLDEHLALGVNIAWYPGFTHAVTWAALWDFMKAFEAQGTKAWEDFVESRRDKPYPTPKTPVDGEGDAKQQELERRYFSETGGSG